MEQADANFSSSEGATAFHRGEGDGEDDLSRIYSSSLTGWNLFDLSF